MLPLLTALNALNFLVSDVLNALGPYCNVYLATDQLSEARQLATSSRAGAAAAFEAAPNA